MKKFLLTFLVVPIVTDFAAEHSITFNFSNPQEHQTVVYKTSPLAQGLYSLFHCPLRTLCLFLPILDRLFGHKIDKGVSYCAKYLNPLAFLGISICASLDMDIFCQTSFKNICKLIASSVVGGVIGFSLPFKSLKNNLASSLFGIFGVPLITSYLFSEIKKNIRFDFLGNAISLSLLGLLTFNCCYVKNIAAFGEKFSSFPACALSYVLGRFAKYVIFSTYYLQKGKSFRKSVRFFAEPDLSKFYKAFACKTGIGTLLGIGAWCASNKFKNMSKLSKIYSLRSDFPLIGFLLGALWCSKKNLPESKGCFKFYNDEFVVNIRLDEYNNCMLYVPKKLHEISSCLILTDLLKLQPSVSCNISNSITKGQNFAVRF